MLDKAIGVCVTSKHREYFVLKKKKKGGGARK
jgi:hypothetical protein